MLVSKTIPNMINGVSQQPALIRLDSQGELQENAWSSVISGLQKRPATQHLAKLDDVNNSSEVFIHTVRRDAQEAYSLLIDNNSTPYVYDGEGNKKSVFVASTANDYLTINSAKDDLKAITIADYTLISNKNKVVAHTLAKSDVLDNEALVYVKLGDYLSEYKIELRKPDGTLIAEAAFTTNDNADVANKEFISTSYIALQLRNLLAVQVIADGWVIDVLASSIYIKPPSNFVGDYAVTVTDAFGGSHLKSFHKTVDALKDLPKVGKNNFQLEVVGTEADSDDNYFVKYNGSHWEEIAGPDSFYEFDTSTLPIALIKAPSGQSHDFILTALDGQTFLTYEVPKWDPREAGNEDTNPFPSFTGQAINDIFFYKNRLRTSYLVNLETSLTSLLTQYKRLSILHL